MDFKRSLCSLTSVASRAMGLLSVLTLGLLLPAAASGQQIIFRDDFETADVRHWTASEPPLLFGCDCYFSGDCGVGAFCNWGVLTSEDNCLWRLPKPNGVMGAGCNVDYNGPWMGGLCDGVCTAAEKGSRHGWYGRATVAAGVKLWGEAILRPAAAGGGLVDPELAAAAKALPMGETDGVLLGRQVASLLSEAADFGFYDFFCHWEAGDLSTQWIVDLSSDSCRLAAGRLAIEALLAELEVPGQGAEAVAEIPLHCVGVELGFGNNCPAGPGALGCLGERIRQTGVFLRTPGSVPPNRRLSGLEALFGS